MPGALGTEISDAEFRQFRDLIYRTAGIAMSDAKKALVVGRLTKRLKARGVATFAAYYQLLGRDGEGAERQTAIDLLTTNETYFFREPDHFQHLRAKALADDPRGRSYRVLSAAASTGEEAYTIAMTLADVLGTRPWEVVGTDISTRVLETARAGRYPLERARLVPPDVLKRHCLRGVGSQAGLLMVAPEIRARVTFVHANLNRELPSLGEFDVIFLRNVMIYFDQDTKRAVVQRLLRRLRPGGWLVIGHSESLTGIIDDLVTVHTTVYRRR